jgi:hypothetical protein
LVGKPVGKSHLEDLGGDGRTILKLILRKYAGRMWMDSSDLLRGPVAGSFEYGNESSGSTKCAEFLLIYIYIYIYLYVYLFVPPMAMIRRLDPVQGYLKVTTLVSFHTSPC